MIALRRQRLPGQHIAKAAGVSPATVSRILKRAGLSRLRDLEPPEPVRRYERQHPGELIHIDIKKLGRFHQVGHRITGDRRRQSNARSRGEGAGWEFVHVCIDDASRIAFTMIMPNEKAKSAIAFLKAAVAYYNSLGVTVAGVMTDNGSCYKAFAFDRACKRLKLKHIRTRPYTPKTNGKAERFIQTALREWGLCQALQHLKRTRPTAPAVDPRLQLASPARQPKSPHTHQPPRPLRGQPVEAPQLEPGASVPGAAFADAARQVPGDPCPERDGAQGRQIKVGRDFEPHLTLPISPAARARSWGGIDGPPKPPSKSARHLALASRYVSGAIRAVA